MAALAALGEIDFEHGGGVDGFDIALVVEIQVRPAYGELSFSDVSLALQYVQGMHRSGALSGPTPRRLHLLLNLTQRRDPDRMCADGQGLRPEGHFEYRNPHTYGS